METISCDLTIIGTGMAGMAAALFAAKRELPFIHVGQTGGVGLSSGLLDLLGVYPIKNGNCLGDPWDGIAAINENEEGHPFSLVENDLIQSSFNELVTELNEAGLSYRMNPGENVEVMTSIGTTKPTYAVPTSMWNGVTALKEKAPCLIIDFDGLKDFSANQIVGTLKKRWPKIRNARISFPGLGDAVKVQPEIMARSMENDDIRYQLIEMIKPLIKDEQFIGFPAILGITETEPIVADLENRLGVAVFEIPTMPVSIPGFRLLRGFENRLMQKGVPAPIHKKILNASVDQEGAFKLVVGDSGEAFVIQSKSVVLASGRYLGKGLIADRQSIRESIFGLPVSQPESREDWYRKKMFDPSSHAGNRAGLEVDTQFRPIGNDNQVIYQSLYAVGSILAHNDWTRMKCGAGVSIASAYQAVQSIENKL